MQLPFLTAAQYSGVSQSEEQMTRLSLGYFRGDFFGTSFKGMG